MNYKRVIIGYQPKVKEIKFFPV